METKVTKNKTGYGYKYTDLAKIHNYLEENNMRYIQKVERIDEDDYIYTKRCIENKWEEEWLQGCRVVQAVLSGKSNPAQEQGSALTYARRYSLLMAFGLATEDDDAESLTEKKRVEELREETINDAMHKALIKAIDNKGITDMEVSEIIRKYGYSVTTEIKMKDYKAICDDFSKLTKKV